MTEMRTYSVRLTPAQRAQLEALGRGGSMGSGVRRLLRIWAVLQQAAQDQPDLPISLVVTLAAKTD